MEEKEKGFKKYFKKYPMLGALISIFYLFLFNYQLYGLLFLFIFLLFACFGFIYLILEMLNINKTDKKAFYIFDIFIFSYMIVCFIIFLYLII